MRRRGNLMLALVLTVVVTAGPAIMAQAEDAPGCEGLGAYHDAMDRARQEAIDDGSIDPDELEMLDERDPLTLSSDDWRKIADNMLALNRVLQSVEPPGWAAELHQLHIDELGLWEQMARTVSTSGLLMALAYTEELERIEAETNSLKAEIAETCPDFPRVFTEAEWGDFAMISEEDTPTPTEPSREQGTRNNPVPFGTAAAVGDGWTMTVLDAIPNATEVVLAESQFNDPPTGGQQFFLVTIAVTYYGSEESATFSSGPSLKVVGESNVAYDTYDPGCGAIPNELPSSRDVFQGGTIEGNVCWSVNSSDADSLVMYADESLDDNRVFFALRLTAPAPAAVPPQPTQTPVSTSPAASPAASPGASPVSGEAITVDMTEFAFDPQDITIPAGTDVEVTLTNSGTVRHDFTVEELDIAEDAEAGESKTITINAPAGTYEVVCTEPGHRESGMVGTMHVQ